MTETSDILFATQGALARVTLNRPKALNALTLGMIRALDTQLKLWAADPTVAAVLITGAGDRAFCAGGDIIDLYNAGPSASHPLFVEFFGEEFTLNRDIYRFAKPYIAIIDGITMGGGCGVSINGDYRVATENTVFAMPETGIGYFPDVGASHFLSRCPHQTGQYLGLTGTRAGAADALYAGLATHYIASDQIEAFAEALSQSLGQDEEPGEVIDRTLDAFAADSGPATIADIAESIARCFGAGTVEEIVTALGAESGAWAEKAAARLGRMSPTSLKVAHRAISEGETLDIEDCLRMELRIALRFMARPDFFEGVRALLVDKDNAPQWRPARLTEVEPSEVAAFFAPLGERDLNFDRDVAAISTGSS